jgi:hypothetical protein
LAALAWFAVGTAQAEIGAYIRATDDYTPGFLVAGGAPLAALVAIVLLWKPSH